MLKVWDIYSGKKMFEFSANLGDGIIISAMDVDKSGKRWVNVHWTINLLQSTEKMFSSSFVFVYLKFDLLAHHPV